MKRKIQIVLLILFFSIPLFLFQNCVYKSPKVNLELHVINGLGTADRAPMGGRVKTSHLWKV